MHDDFNIRIFQPNVRPYRVALFDGVGKRYIGRVSLCAAPYFDVDTPSCPLSAVTTDYNHPYSHFAGLHWQHGFSLDGLERGDIVVICGEPRNLSMMWLAVRARRKGIGVVWWGLHRMPNQNMFNLSIRRRLMFGLADTILFYNKSGIDWLRNEGFDVRHVFATGNTINQETIKNAIAYWTPDKLSGFRKEQGIDGKKVILACSRIIEKQRLHEAIEAMAMGPLDREDTMLAVIGDGPLRQQCEELASRLKVSARIRWIGSLYDENEVAPWFLSARAFTYPGPVGLAILKALSYGLPVVINDTHNSTEAEIMENNKTGLLFRESDVKDLACKLNELMSDENRWQEMSSYSRKVAYENYSMDQMVDNFCSAIEDAHAQKIRS